MILPSLAHTAAGDAVTSLCEHKGLIRGTVVIGNRADGEPVMIDEKVIARFWPKVDKRADDECWPWTGAVDSRGYGLLRIGKSYRRASMVSLAAHKGSPPPGKPLACHSCDNPPCVNPAHLWWGSNADNMQDSAAKGRNIMQRRTHCPKGHPYSGRNLIRTKRGRVCRSCYNAYKRRQKADRKKKRAALPKPPRARPVTYQCGHPRIPENTITRGRERCRACTLENQRQACARYRARKRMSPGRDGEHDLELG